MKLFNRFTPESSQIKQVSYDKEKKQLTVYFKTNSTYQYNNVPLEIWEGINSAASVGSYLNQKIKGNFNYEKL